MLPGPQSVVRSAPPYPRALPPSLRRLCVLFLPVSITPKPTFTTPEVALSFVASLASVVARSGLRSIRAFLLVVNQLTKALSNHCRPVATLFLLFTSIPLRTVFVTFVFPVRVASERFFFPFGGTSFSGAQPTTSAEPVVLVNMTIFRWYVSLLVPSYSCEGLKSRRLSRAYSIPFCLRSRELVLASWVETALERRFFFYESCGSRGRFIVVPLRVNDFNLMEDSFIHDHINSAAKTLHFFLVF